MLYQDHSGWTFALAPPALFGQSHESFYSLGSSISDRNVQKYRDFKNTFGSVGLITGMHTLVIHLHYD